MSCAQTGEPVSLHDTAEPVTLARRDDVDLDRAVTFGSEDVGRDLLADRVGRRVRRADLDDVTPRRHACLREVSGDRLVDLARVDRTEGDLHGVVAVLV